MHPSFLQPPSTGHLTFLSLTILFYKVELLLATQTVSTVWDS